MQNSHSTNCKNVDKSINERLDSTETLLRQMNEKFDRVFTNKSKLKIDLNKVQCKSGSLKLSKVAKSNKKNRENKMKSLIKKILNNRENINDTDPSFTIESVISSDGNDPHKPTDSTALVDEKSESAMKYERIIEETSDLNESQSSPAKLKDISVSLFPII